MSFPLQPIITDDQGVVRFKANGIVAYLLESGAIDLNVLHELSCGTPEDWEQFNQLIGYSLSAWGGLQHTSDESWEAANMMHKQGLSSLQARLEAVEGELAALREAMADPIARLYGKHRDDLLSSD